MASMVTKVIGVLWLPLFPWLPWMVFYPFVVPMASMITTCGYHVYECSCGYHGWNGYCLVVLMASIVTTYGHQGYRCPLFTIVSVVTMVGFLLSCGSHG